MITTKTKKNHQLFTETLQTPKIHKTSITYVVITETTTRKDETY